MKKLITIILVLALLLPAAALSEQDPIVGTWYLYVSIPGSPMEGEITDYDSAVSLLVFSEEGKIYFLELDFAGSNLTDNGLKTIGKWEKKESGYELSIVSVGISDALIRDGNLYAAIFSTELYMMYRKMEPFNFYTEMYRK